MGIMRRTWKLTGTKTKGNWCSIKCSANKNGVCTGNHEQRRSDTCRKGEVDETLNPR